MPISEYNLINQLRIISPIEELEEIHDGLKSVPRRISSKYFYDAKGSLLFEDICRLPEYYQTRTELQIIRDIAPRIFHSGNIEIIELGAGESLKIRALLRNSMINDYSLINYIPIDVSESALRQSANRLTSDYPGIRINAILADFTNEMKLPLNGAPKMFFFFGSTIGNLDQKQAIDLLNNIASIMLPGDRFFIGFDRIKPIDIIEAAYNDSMGITADFNLNILSVINSITGSNFDRDKFEHLAFFDVEKSRIEMHLRAKESMNVDIPALDINIKIRSDETIHTENSHKYSNSDISSFAKSSGLSVKGIHSDNNDLFSIAELIKND